MPSHKNITSAPGKEAPSHSNLFSFGTFSRVVARVLLGTALAAGVPSDDTFHDGIGAKISLKSITGYPIFSLKEVDISEWRDCGTAIQKALESYKSRISESEFEVLERLEYLIGTVATHPDNTAQREEAIKLYDEVGRKLCWLKLRDQLSKDWDFHPDSYQVVGKEIRTNIQGNQIILKLGADFSILSVTGRNNLGDERTVKLCPFLQTKGSWGVFADSIRRGLFNHLLSEEVISGTKTGIKHDVLELESTSSSLCLLRIRPSISEPKNDHNDLRPYHMIAFLDGKLYGAPASERTEDFEEKQRELNKELASLISSRNALFDLRKIQHEKADPFPGSLPRNPLTNLAYEQLQKLSKDEQRQLEELSIAAVRCRASISLLSIKSGRVILEPISPPNSAKKEVEFYPNVCAVYSGISSCRLISVHPNTDTELITDNGLLIDEVKNVQFFIPLGVQVAIERKAVELLVDEHNSKKLGAPQTLELLELLSRSYLGIENLSLPPNKVADWLIAGAKECPSKITTEHLVSMLPDVGRALAKHDKDANPWVRQLALIGAFSTPCNESVELLKLALKDSDTGVKTQAAYLLAKLHQPEGISTLLPMIVESGTNIQLLGVPNSKYWLHEAIIAAKKSSHPLLPALIDQIAKTELDVVLGFYFINPSSSILAQCEAQLLSSATKEEFKNKILNYLDSNAIETNGSSLLPILSFAAKLLVERPHPVSTSDKILNFAAVENRLAQKRHVEGFEDVFKEAEKLFSKRAETEIALKSLSERLKYARKLNSLHPGRFSEEVWGKLVEDRFRAPKPNELRSLLHASDEDHNGAFSSLDHVAKSLWSHGYQVIYSEPHSLFEFSHGPSDFTKEAPKFDLIVLGFHGEQKGFRVTDTVHLHGESLRIELVHIAPTLVNGGSLVALSCSNGIGKGQHENAIKIYRASEFPAASGRIIGSTTDSNIRYLLYDSSNRVIGAVYYEGETFQN